MQSTARPGGKSQAVKLLKGWGIRFKGSAKEDPEVFLDRLEACIEDAGEPLENLLRAMPCVLDDRAFIGFKTMKSHIKTWRDFKKRFREQYVTEYDRVDLLDDLHKRTQAKGERIAPYINSLRYIVTHFKVPPSERELMETAYRNLLPEYRRAMADKLIETMDDIERYGKYWERQKEMNSRCPPSYGRQNESARCGTIYRDGRQDEGGGRSDEGRGSSGNDESGDDGKQAVEERAQAWSKQPAQRAS